MTGVKNFEMSCSISNWSGFPSSSCRTVTWSQMASIWQSVHFYPFHFKEKASFLSISLHVLFVTKPAHENTHQTICVFVLAKYKPIVCSNWHVLFWFFSFIAHNTTFMDLVVAPLFCVVTSLLTPHLVLNCCSHSHSVSVMSQTFTIILIGIGSNIIVYC